MLLLFIINTFDTETNVVISVKIDGSCKYITGLKPKLHVDGQQVRNSSQGFTKPSVTRFYQVYVRARLCVTSEELQKSSNNTYGHHFLCQTTELLDGY